MKRGRVVLLVVLGVVVLLWVLAPWLGQPALSRALGDLKRNEGLLAKGGELSHAGLGFALSGLSVATTGGVPVASLGKAVVTPCGRWPGACLSVQGLTLDARGLSVWGRTRDLSGEASQALRPANYQTLEGHLLGADLEGVVLVGSAETTALPPVRATWMMPAPHHGLLGIVGSAFGLTFRLESDQDSLELRATFGVPEEGTAEGVLSEPTPGWRGTLTPIREWKQVSGPGGQSTERLRHLLGFPPPMRE